MQNKQVKRETIQRLAAERSNRSITQQLTELDNRLGAGVGAKKERERLIKLLTQ